MTQEWIRQFEANALLLAKVGLGIGITIWAVRRRLESDLVMDQQAASIRWSAILICWGVASIPALGPRPIQAVAAVLGLGAFWWPNSVIHVMRRVRRRTFLHIEAWLRRWNPAGLEETDAAIVSSYDSYAPRILNALQVGREGEPLMREMEVIRRDFANPADDARRLADRAAANELLAWWSVARSDGQSSYV